MNTYKLETRVVAAVGVVAMFGALALVPFFAFANTVTPSTNDQNKVEGWAHVNELSVGVGEIDLELVSTRGFVSCFEYRTDGDTSQTVSDTNFNGDITDGLYPYQCVSNATFPLTLEADEYVEVRMVFGPEGDERFDWTRFYVLPQPEPEEKNQCKKGGYEDFGFKNQGKCIQYVNTGKDSR